jgi:hypothetical protein
MRPAPLKSTFGDLEIKAAAALSLKLPKKLATAEIATSLQPLPVNG